MNKLRLTPTTDTEAGGLIIFRLGLHVGGKEVQYWLVNSGQPHAQALMTYDNPLSYSGDQRPIPEAIYRVGPLEFAGGKFDWADSWGPGLGDFWAAITPIQGESKRRAFGFHWDENRSYSPGSLGCVVFATKGDVESFVKACRKHDPKQLIVDYGFGTVPNLQPVTDVLTGTLWANKNGLTLELDGDTPKGSYSVYSSGGTPGGGWLIKLTKKKS